MRGYGDRERLYQEVCCLIANNQIYLLQEMRRYQETDRNTNDCDYYNFILAGRYKLRFYLHYKHLKCA